VQPQVEAAAQQNQEKVAVQLQAKQSKARAVSLLCYGAGSLDAADVGHMLQLVVLVKHGDLFVPAAAGSAADELPALRVQCRQVMARRLPAVLAALQEQPAAGNALLNTAVSGVLTRLKRAPKKLQWQQVTGSSSSSSSSMASFQAVGSDGHLYSINILDGMVLLDGVPPGRLPSDVLQHPLYRRTFGSCNFEVVVTQAGMWQTLRPINGRFYDFYWSSSTAAAASTAGSCSSGRRLVIEEVEQATGDRLQLLDVGEDDSCGAWGGQLPVMLQQLYSHWYHRWGAIAACGSNNINNVLQPSAAAIVACIVWACGECRVALFCFHEGFMSKLSASVASSMHLASSSLGITLSLRPCPGPKLPRGGYQHTLTHALSSVFCMTLQGQAAHPAAPPGLPESQPALHHPLLHINIHINIHVIISSQPQRPDLLACASALDVSALAAAAATAKQRTAAAGSTSGAAAAFRHPACAEQV
jgi:hypothetical protein